MTTLFKPFTLINLPAVITPVYTTPALTTTSVTSCIFSNKTISDVNIDVYVVRAAAQGGLTAVVVNDGLIPAGSSLDIVSNKPIVLGPGDMLAALTPFVAAVDVIGSIMEQN